MTSKLQKIIIFQEKISGEMKIAGLREYGRNIELSDILNVDADLPQVIDDPGQYIPANFNADLVICFLKHPDLVEYLAGLCLKKGIPIIASGKKVAHAITPFTCCGLGKLPGLGPYGEQFGFPELTVTVEKDRIANIEVKRGSSCGATWAAATRMLGLSTSEAISAYAREVQYHCAADPAAFDPVIGKSSLHYAGDIHAAALKKALARS